MLSYKRIHLRMFLENTEVSISQISMTAVGNHTANIVIIPHRDMLEIKAGTTVCVFYKDPKNSSYVSVELDEYAGLNDTEKIALDSYENYSLLFMGQVESYSLSRVSVSRAGSLECTGHFSNLKRFKTFTSNTTNTILNKSQRFVGASKFFNTTAGEHQLAKQIADSFSNESEPLDTPGFGGLQGPARGFISVVEKCIGVIGKDGNESKGAQQEFFAIVNKHKKILHQVGAIDVDQNVSKLLNLEQSKLLLDRSANSTSGLTDLLSFLTRILNFFYYKIYAVPCGRIIPDTASSEDVTEFAKNTMSSSDVNFDYPLYKVNEAKKTASTISTITFTASLEASKIVSLNFKEKYESIFWEGINAGKREIKEALSKEVNNLIDRCQESFKEDVYTNFRNSLGKFYEGYYIPLINKTSAEANMPISEAEIIAATFKQIETLLLSGITAAKQATIKPTYIRVLNYLLLPDLFFAVPPTCNVLFPNQISSMNYQADVFSKPSRLMLYSDQAMQSKSTDTRLNNVYFAPSLEHLEKFQGVNTPESSLPLLEHEHHTGVVPIFKKINFFEQRSLTALGGSGTRNKHTQHIKLANFQLLQERFKEDRISATGPFNPFACPGLPCALMDTDTSGSDEPTVYLGYLQSVSHSISTSNATTSYIVQYVRTFEEVDELFSDATLEKSSETEKHKIMTKNEITLEDGSIYWNSFEQFLINIIKSKIEAAYNSSNADNGEGLLLYSNKKIINSADAEIELDIGGKVSFTNLPEISAFFEQNFNRIEGSNGDVQGVENIWVESVLEEQIGRFLWNTSEITVNFEQLKINYLTAIDKKLQIEDNNSFAIESELIILGGIVDNWVNSAAGSHTVEGWAWNIEINLKSLDISKSFVKEDRFNIINFYTPDFFSHSYNFDDQFIGYKLFSADSLLIKKSNLAGNGVKFVVYAQKNSLESLDVGVDISNKSLVTEELYRPSWYGENFSALNIGEKVYSPLLGSGSVQDYLANSTEEKDAAIFDTEADSVKEVYSTKKSILYALKIYNAMTSSVAREQFVESYVKRPVANMGDILGPKGFFSDIDESEVSVVDNTKNCPPGKVQVEHGHTKETSVDPNLVIEEKRHACNTYEVHTRRRAFK